jgi:uncharacterized membrane protein YfcA
VSPLDATLVLIIGTIVGVLPGLFGVGGAFLMVPALNLLAKVPLDIAIGSSACQVLGPATTGVLHRRAAGTLYLQLPLTMLGGTVAGVWLGMLFVDWADQSHGTLELHGRTVPRLETVMMFCYFLLLVVLAGIVAWETWQHSRNGGSPHRGRWESWRLPPLGTFSELDGREFSIPILSALATLVGFLNSGLGMGGGILLVPALVSLVGLSPHRAMNVSLVLTWFGGIGTTIGHSIAADPLGDIGLASSLLIGRVDLGLVCLLLVGGTLGAKLGSIISDRLGGERLRGYFALVILLVAVVIGGRLAHLVWG